MASGRGVPFNKSIGPTAPLSSCKAAPGDQQLLVQALVQRTAGRQSTVVLSALLGRHLWRKIGCFKAQTCVSDRVPLAPALLGRIEVNPAQGRGSNLPGPPTVLLALLYSVIPLLLDATDVRHRSDACLRPELTVATNRAWWSARSRGQPG